MTDFHTTVRHCAPHAGENDVDTVTRPVPPNIDQIRANAVCALRTLARHPEANPTERAAADVSARLLTEIHMLVQYPALGTEHDRETVRVAG